MQCTHTVINIYSSFATVKQSIDSCTLDHTHTYIYVREAKIASTMVWRVCQSLWVRKRAFSVVSKQFGWCCSLFVVAKGVQHNAQRCSLSFNQRLMYTSKRNQTKRNEIKLFTLVVQSFDMNVFGDLFLEGTFFKSDIQFSVMFKKHNQMKVDKNKKNYISNSVVSEPFPLFVIRMMRNANKNFVKKWNFIKRNMNLRKIEHLGE